MWGPSRGRAGSTRVLYYPVLQLAFNAILLGVSRGSRALAFLLVTIFVGRVAGTDALGAFTVALATALIALRVSELGVNTFLVRESSRAPERAPDYLMGALVIRLPSLALTFATALVVILITGVAGTTAVLIWLMTGYVALWSVASIFFASALARQKMQEETLIALPSSVVLVAASAVVLYAGGGLVELGLVFLCVGAAELVLALLLISPRVAVWSSRVDLGAARAMLSEAWPIGLATLFAFLYYRIDTLMLASITDNTEVGEYGMAYNFLYGPSLIFWALSMALFPILSAHRLRRGRALRRQYRLLVASGAAFGLFFLAFAPLAGVGLRAAYGSAPENSVLALRILLFAQPFTFVGAAAGITLIAIGAQRLNVAIGGLGVLVNVSLNALAIPRWGGPGAAGATVATEVAVAALAVTLLAQRGLVPLHLRLVASTVAQRIRPSRHSEASETDRWRSDG